VVGDLVILVYFIRSPDSVCLWPRGALPRMRETKELLRPVEEVEYQPEPGSLAGFIASLTEKVDELLLAANLRPNLE